MLKLIIEGDEVFNEETAEFSTVDDAVVYLEHSLISLSKWEAKYQEPFLSSTDKTHEQIMDYIQFMIFSPGESSEIVSGLSKKNIEEIQAYIDSPQSATTFGEMPDRKSRGEVITSELIYYWLVAYNIPFECQSWHLNRLLALIRICNIKNGKQKKMSRNEIAQRNRDLNAKRKAALGTTG